MLIDSGYLGFMDFGNFWGIVMLLKHILVFGMLALGFWYNAILRVGPMMGSNNNAELGISRFRLYSNLMAISGVLILLLTALAQVR
jgi:putative copper export protein